MSGGRWNLSEGPVTFAADTDNVKIRSKRLPRTRGRVATTYVSIKASCPDSCAMKADGTCYAQGGMVGMQVRKIEARSVGATPTRAANIESGLIDNAFNAGPIPQDGAKGGRDLRLHTSGDCRTPYAALTVGAAAARWKARGGGDVWTYTHAWKAVRRGFWGSAVSVLASVDDVSEGTLSLVKEQGYAPARVVPEFPNGAKAFEDAGMRWIPCPAQTQDGVGCADCRLCFNADKLFNRDTGIAFEAHGNRAHALKRKLQVLK